MWYLCQTMFHKCNIKVHSDRKVDLHFPYQMCHEMTDFPKSSPTNELRLCIPKKKLKGWYLFGVIDEFCIKHILKTKIRSHFFKSLIF